MDAFYTDTAPTGLGCFVARVFYIDAAPTGLGFSEKIYKKGAVGNRAFVVLGMGIPAYFKMTIFRMDDVSSVSSW